MKTRICAFLLALVLLVLSGCRGGEETELPSLTGETAVYEGDGYRLTYPACFAPVGKTDKMVNFAVNGGNMAFTLTTEDNPHGERDIGEYPALLGIYDGVTILDAHSFGVERYQENFLSAYYLYTFTADTIWLLEYNFSGSAEQRALEPLFAVKPTE